MRQDKVFALIDCNNFFVSCERVFRPDLWNKPVAVLSNNDGCIVARSNEVKAMGIPMAAPYFQWEKQLKDGGVTLFSGNFALYGDISQRIVTILEGMAPNVEAYSVDESFVDLTDVAVDDYTAWAQKVRDRIWQWTGVPVSVGVASSKTLAKAAAEFAKKHPEIPAYYSIVGDEDKRIALLKWLPIGDVWGFGWRSVPKLHERGIRTAYDLTQASEKWVQQQFTIRGLKTQLELKGIAAVEAEHDPRPQKSLARTRTFPHRVSKYHELESAVATFAASAAAKLRRNQEAASSIVTFIRTGHHAEVRRSVSAAVRLAQASDDTATIIKAALHNLEQIYDPDFGYKRAGVILVDLCPKDSAQINLFSQQNKLSERSRLMEAVDAINSRYGTRLVTHASEGLGKAWQSKRQSRSPRYTTDWQELARAKA